MKRCPVTYEEIPDQARYSQRGLRLLSVRLKDLLPLAYTAEQQRQEAMDRASKMSIQGVQKKLSAQLKIGKGAFELVDRKGHYILKPQNNIYPELPENEALTMTLAESIGLDVPLHGLIYSKDGSMTYFIKRFDRAGHHQRLAQEDFAQLSGEGRDTKYESSMEKVVDIVSEFCSYPKVEYVKLLKLTLFNFLMGNEDMHLKNFSLITRGDKVTLSPVYDLLNTSIAINNPAEEMALPLHGKKRNLTQNDFLRYFAEDRLALNQVIIADVVKEIRAAIPGWRMAIRHSFLSEGMKEKYLQLLNERCERFGW